MAEKYLLTKSSEDTAALFGAFDANIRLIETAFDVRISNRRGGEGSEGDEIVIGGEAEGCACAHRVLEYLGRMTGAGEVLDTQTVEYVISLFRDGGETEAPHFSEDVICLTSRGKPIKAKPSPRSIISSRSVRIRWSWDSALPERVRPFLPLRWQWRRCGARRSIALF